MKEVSVPVFINTNESPLNTLFKQSDKYLHPRPPTKKEVSKHDQSLKIHQIKNRFGELLNPEDSDSIENVERNLKSIFDQNEILNKSSSGAFLDSITSINNLISVPITNEICKAVLAPKNRFSKDEYSISTQKMNDERQNLLFNSNIIRNNAGRSKKVGDSLRNALH